jgi:hypothetical protein
MDADVSWNDVWRCCHDQFGSALSFRHNTITNEVQFYTESPERVFKRSDTIPTLRLQGSRNTITVLLLAPFVQPPYAYMTDTTPETKVVPTRSKKLLLT